MQGRVGEWYEDKPGSGNWRSIDTNASDLRKLSPAHILGGIPVALKRTWDTKTCVVFAS